MHKHRRSSACIYIFGRFLEIAELISSYYEALEKVDASALADSTCEKVIAETRAEFGIVVTGNSVSFKDIPTFENELPELKNILYIVSSHTPDNGNAVTVIKNSDQFSDKDWYGYLKISNGETSERGYSTDASTKETIESSATTTIDVLFGIRNCDSVSDLTMNGEPAETIEITAEEVLQLLAPIFDGDQAFIDLCDQYDINIA